MVESLGSDLYAYFHIESEGVQSDQLADTIEPRKRKRKVGNLTEGREIQTKAKQQIEMKLLEYLRSSKNELPMYIEHVSK